MTPRARNQAVPPTQAWPGGSNEAPAGEGDYSDMWRTIGSLVVGVIGGTLIGAVLGNIIWTLGTAQ